VRELQRELVYARYPLKIADKWITPMEYYTQKKARRMVDDAKFVVDGIKEYLRRRNEDSLRAACLTNLSEPPFLHHVYL